MAMAAAAAALAGGVASFALPPFGLVPLIAALSLPALIHIGGELRVDRAPTSSISLPALVHVGGDARVRECTSLGTMNAPSWTSLGGVSFEIVDNPGLDRDQVCAILNQLQANGYAGLVDTAGNNPNAPCP